MRRLSTFARISALSLFPSFLCLPPLAAQKNPPPTMPAPNPGTIPSRVFSVNGMVSDAATHARIDYVKLELHSVNGAVVGTVFSNTNGTFQFDNVSPGSYTLVADLVGFESVSQPVEVDQSSVYGVQIDLVKAADSEALILGGPGTVSARELSIPPKAHDDMEKGLALLYAKSDYPGSLKAFEKAIGEYPDYYEAYTQIGIAYVKLADAANAETAFRKSIELSHEKYADAYFGLADLFLGAKRLPDAESTARKAIEIDPNRWQGHAQLARALVELRRPSEAEPSAVTAVKLKPENPTLYLVLANIHIQLQNNPALLDDLNHYLKLAPDGPFAEQARRERDQIQQGPAASQTSPPAPSTAQP